MALIKCPECGKEISSLAKSCPHCGCPIEAQDAMIVLENSDQQPVELVVTKHPVRGKIPAKGIVATAIVVVAIFVGIVVTVILPMSTESTYNRAMSLLESGEYTEGRALLAKIPDYEDAAEVLEETRFETYVYSAANALRKILKNPDSLYIYDVQFYDKAEGEERDNPVNDDPSLLVDANHPAMILSCAAQNGFGGNASSYVISCYDTEEQQYTLVEYSSERLIEDLNEYDDDYNSELRAIVMMDIMTLKMREIGSVDIDRVNQVIENADYGDIEIAQ